MVYHEERKVNGKLKNYLVFNSRKKGGWEKKSKFIGIGKLSKKEISKRKKEFEKELAVNKKYKFLLKEQAKKIENLKEIYNRKINSFKQEELKQFKEAFFTELTYDSNAIEGNSLSLQETSLIINEGISPKGKSLREIYEAKNHAKAIQYIGDYNGDLTEGFILKLHSIILNEISERFAGKYREKSIRVAGCDFKFPSPEKVPQLIGNLVYWYNKNKSGYHVFELAVLVSSRFVSIHPFVDGNGRVSRLIMNFLLHKNKCPWINVYKKQREKYLKEIRKANDEKYLDLIKFLISSLEENLRDFEFI